MDSDLWKSLLRLSSPHSAKRAWTAHELLRLLSVTSTPIIADAMNGNNVLPALIAVLSGASAVGPVTTVQTDSMDWGTTVRAIESASRGDVLFIYSTSTAASVWGGLTSRAAQQRGLTGTIVYGSCRDVTTIRELKYPTWARTTTPRAGKPLNKGLVNVPLVVRGVTINPGDVVKADDEGVVVVPASSLMATANNVVDITAKEQFIEEGLKSGASLSGFLDDFSP